MIDIVYKVGDVLEINNTDICIIIPHICNDMGKWGAGFTGNLSKKSKKPEQCYRNNQNNLGEVNIVNIGFNKYIANMIAQHGVRSKINKSPIDYNALEQCLLRLSTIAKYMKSEIHMPRIGTGFAGGDWNTIENLIIKILCNEDIKVFVYDLK